MKAVLLVGLCLLLVTVTAPAATATGVICDYDGSVVNRFQACANAAIDNAQEKAEDVFCDVVCNL